MEDAGDVLYDLDQPANSTDIAPVSLDYAAYLLFVILSCSMGILVAISIGCGVIGEPKWWLCRDTFDDDDCTSEANERRRATSPAWNVKAVQVTLLLLLGGCATLVAWGSIVRANSIIYHDYEKTAKGLACIIFGLVGILASYTVLTCGLRGDLRTRVIMTSTYFLLLPGWVLLATSFKVLSISPTRDYERITMSVTNSRLQFDNSIECRYGGTVCSGYRGQIQVSWDLESCPQAHPGLSCSDWILDPTCDQYTHDGSNMFVEDEVDASVSVAECIRQLYNIEVVLGGDIERDQQLESTNLPTVDAYGSCSLPCRAVLVTSNDLVALATKVGLAMSVVGVFIVLMAGLLCPRKQISKPSTQKDDSEAVSAKILLGLVESQRRQPGLGKGKTCSGHPHGLGMMFVDNSLAICRVESSSTETSAHTDPLNEGKEEPSGGYFAHIYDTTTGDGTSNIGMIGREQL